MSVVIVNYNYARFLPEAVESVLAQNYDNCEILVVDDGSTDDSHSILKRYEQRVRLVFQENRGVSAARNRGIAESTAPLVAFLDSDDLWHPDKLVRQIERFHDASVGMVYTGLCYVDVDGNALGTMLDGSRGQVLEDIALLRSPGVPASGSSAMVRRSVLDNVGPFDESLSTSGRLGHVAANRLPHDDRRSSPSRSCSIANTRTRCTRTSRRSSATSSELSSRCSRTQQREPCTRSSDGATASST